MAAPVIFILYLIAQFPHSMTVDLTAVGSYPTKEACMMAQKTAQPLVVTTPEGKYLTCIRATKVNDFIEDALTDSLKAK